MFHFASLPSSSPSPTPYPLQYYMPSLRQQAMDCLKSLFRHLLRPKSEPEKGLEIVSKTSISEYQQDSDRRNRGALPILGRKSSPFLSQRNRKLAFELYSVPASTRPSTDQASRNALMIEKVKDDAEETYHASRRERIKQHARKISAKFSTTPAFQGDLPTA